MFFWLVFGSIFLVWNVFQSSGLDFRLVALGALLPDVLDAPWAAQSYAHTLLAAVWVLALTMVLTVGRGQRLRRRRALSISIGWFCGLVLGLSWTHKGLFWWPAFGAERPDASLFGPVVLVVVEEVLGVAAAWWTWTRFGLRDHERRRVFWRTGRLTIAEGAQ